MERLYKTFLNFTGKINNYKNKNRNKNVLNSP